MIYVGIKLMNNFLMELSQSPPENTDKFLITFSWDMKFWSPVVTLMGQQIYWFKL